MNRNEELAKLLGIEPKSLCEINLLEDDEKCNTGFPCYVCEANEAKYYPDFTQPSNFVKLCFFKFPNFNNEYYNILEFVSDNFVEIENVNEYIESLYEQLKLEDKRIIKDLSKQAQATQWTY